MRISSEEIQAIVARQRAQQNASAAFRMAHAAKRFDASKCNCGTPAGYHTRNCSGH